MDLFERAILEYVRQAAPTNVDLYGFCLEQGFCASEGNKALRKLQQAGSITVTDIGTAGAARKGSFYLTDDSVRARFGESTHAAEQD